METINNSFKKITPTEITDNFFKTINDEWMLITAGTQEKFNTMTASWGAVGILWNKKVAIAFVRPTRHTYKFMNENDTFTFSFFTDKERSILQYCGSKSGRDVDKVAKTGLIPIRTEPHGISFQQSRLVLVCRKIYYDDLKPSNFLLPETERQNYPLKDYHRMFISEIQNAYIKV
jgi:flavin reductase (DIM6/NTAB) family NADH-FMN oxidoreductase RutF